jgi:dCMP deaminase
MSSDWDKRWLGSAADKGSWSKDRSRKIGCVIVNPDNVEVSNGWNGFPRGIDDDVETRHVRPTKYLWTEHAERNALYNAARTGRATKGCSIYQTMFPCVPCARGIIQAGLIEVITREPDWNDSTYGEEWGVAKEMLEEADVTIRFVEGEHMSRNENIPTVEKPKKQSSWNKFWNKFWSMDLYVRWPGQTRK